MVPRVWPARLLIIVLAQVCCFAQQKQPLGSHVVPILTVDGLKFRDLNRDGKLEAFEDWRLTPQVRARDLAGRLSLEEKAGLMMHASARPWDRR